METKEDKIKRIKKEMNIRKMWCKRNKHRNSAICYREDFKILRAKLKELEKEEPNGNERAED